MSPTVLVIGGGPAGLAAATAAKDGGAQVTIFDAADRLGGKLGADADPTGVRRDHGLHIFPGWYKNLRTLLARLGLASQLVDHERVAYVGRGEFPAGVRTMAAPTGLRAALGNTFRGPLPWWEAAIYQYFMLDLAGQKFSRRGYLDRLSETGLLYSRWYRSEAVAEFIEQNVLHAASVNASEISAMSWQHVLRFWLRTPRPFFSILRGDLQTALIDPWVLHLTTAGVTITRDRRVTRLLVGPGGRLTGVAWTSSGGAGGVTMADAVVLAVPVEQARGLVDEQVFAVAPELAQLNRLVSEPMSGYHLDLGRKIPGLGGDFLFLTGSRHALSLVDLTPAAPTTSLSVVIGDYGPLRTLSRGLVAELIEAELRAFVPFDPATVTARYLHDNVSAPLFVNSVGAWHHRPEARTSLRGLYVAGDWCRNPIDLATTEGALCSGMAAAVAALRELGLSAPAPITPPETPRWVYRAAKVMGAPLVALPVAYGKLFGRR